MTPTQPPKPESRTLTLQVEVFLIPEGEQVVAYCPALELSTYGDSVADVKTAFQDVLQIFVDDTTARGTLEKELLRLSLSHCTGL